MNITSLNTSEFKPKAYRYCKLQQLLVTFINSPYEVARVLIEPEEYSSLRSVQSALSAASRRLKLPVKTRNVCGQLYLFKIVD